MTNKKTSIFAVLIAITVFLSSCEKAKVLPVEQAVKSMQVSATSTTTSTFTSNPKNLNIVMFVPTDNPALSDYRTRLTTLMVHFQSWLHTEMLRYGYDKYMGLPLDTGGLVKFIQIPAQGPQADYPYTASVSATKIINEINAYKTTHPGEFSNASHMLILMPQRTDGSSEGQPFYGWGKYCFALDNSNMAVDKIPSTSNYLGGMLHELGHGLNLPHDHAKYTSEQPVYGTSLMGSGNVTFSKGQPTFLTPVDAAILNRNEVFQSPLPTEIPYASATTTINANLTYDSGLQTLNLIGNFTSDKTVSDILVYMDPKISSSDADYNAVTWRFNPGAGNTLTGAMALNELNFKNNEPYDVRVKLLLNNGNTISKAYSFSFLNGVPQIGANGSAKFFQHGSYGGYGVSLPVGNYTTANLASLGISDNDVSSLTLGFGVKVILYDGDNFTGSSIEMTSSSSFVSTFNDKASSIKVIAL
jgi:hypothetical protein